MHIISLDGNPHGNLVNISIHKKKNAVPYMGYNMANVYFILGRVSVCTKLLSVFHLRLG